MRFQLAARADLIWLSPGLSIMRFNYLSQFKVTGNFRMLAAALGSSVRNPALPLLATRGPNPPKCQHPGLESGPQLFCEILWAEQVA